MSKNKKLFDKARQEWQNSLNDSPLRDYNFDTLSGKKLDPLYYPKDPDDKYMKNIGFPGQFPFTRGVHSSMYRGKLWTKRQFSGFGTALETNKRYHSLLNKGQTGLSVAYDMPTLMGYDPDHPWSEGEVGKCGVSVSSLDDMEDLFSGINIGEILLTIFENVGAAVLLPKLSKDKPVFL